MKAIDNLARERRTLDCSRVRVFAGWFAIGITIPLLVQFLMVCKPGHDWTTLLRVGSESNIRPRIESELGPVSTIDPIGHDGQIFYLIARDPAGIRGVPEHLPLFCQPQYRYRRILYPLLAGGGGSFSGPMTLLGMIAWTAIGSGLATVATADICHSLQLRRWTVILAACNPGVLFSSLLLTSDVLALGLALSGVALMLRGKERMAVAAFALAVLSKETFLIFPIAFSMLALKDRRFVRSGMTLFGSALPFLLWSVWLALRMMPGNQSLHHITFPGYGILESGSFWFTDSGLPDGLTGVFGVGMLLLSLGLVALDRRSSQVIRWNLLLWSLLGSVLSLAVWGVPLNAVRVLSPLWFWLSLAVSSAMSAWTRRGLAAAFCWKGR